MHKNYYDFFDAEKTVKGFISRGKVKAQGSVEIINYQLADEIDQLIELERKRTWLSDVYTCVYFNAYVKRDISKSFMERVIINCVTGSSWPFKRFECLSVIVTSENNDFSLA